MSAHLEKMLYRYGALARTYGDERSIWILTRLQHLRSFLERVPL